jgi:hypothetical protein
MHFTNHEWWTLLHGMVFGAAFLLAFGGGLAGLYSLRPGLLTTAGVTERVRRLKIGVVVMAVAAWGTVITGTWIVYPWYRDPAKDSPKSLLLADPKTADWHDFGMEWKEHVGWLAPFLATAVAVTVLRNRELVRRDPRVRRLLGVLFVTAFAATAVAAGLGAAINKVSPNDFLFAN